MPEFDLSRLQDAPLDVSKLTCQCQIWKSRRNHRRGGVITFRGVYKPGSAGTDDARLIRWRIKQFYELYFVDGVVLDCTELDYVWGDDLFFPTPDPLNNDKFPMLVVIRPEQAEAYGYVVDVEDQRNDLTAR